MRFDELNLEDPEGELRVRLHPELTVLSGLGPVERQALAESIVGSAAGGREATTLHYTDADGDAHIAISRDGQITSQHQDGSPADLPLGRLARDPAAFRSLMLLSAQDLGVLTQVARDNDPPELREARATLDELTAELNAALGQQQAVDLLQEELDGLEEELLAARDGVARREYAQVLAQLERVRAEAAALQASAESVESDLHLLSSADTARSLVETWNDASARVMALTDRLDDVVRLDDAECERLSLIPEELPENLDALVDDVRRAIDARAALDHRLQELSVSKLPAPSDPMVAELGLLDQDPLWQAAERLADATATMQRLRISFGGSDADIAGAASQVIETIEAAHAKLESAERAASAARLPGLGGVGVGVGAGVVGLAAMPVLLPIGLAGAVIAAGAGLVLPGARRAKAARAEAAALLQAEATSYLGFHIRRVEASVDPKMRSLADNVTVEHRTALATWLGLVGHDIELARAQALREEIEAYNEALRNLGGAADEIEELRRELTEQADPMLARARRQLLLAAEPFLVEEGDLEDLDRVAACLIWQRDRGIVARTQLDLGEAEVDREKAAARLDDLLLELGFEGGPVDARVGALEWAVTRAADRRKARDAARPSDELDAELIKLQDTATKLRRPEWAGVTAADAATPDIGDLEGRRAELVTQMATARVEVDIERLADRRSAVERRVAALEAQHAGRGCGGDPGDVADIKQHLLAQLLIASTAGPAGDPIPVILDEVFLQVPADRKWDLLDLLHQVATTQQLIYLSDDAFVAAWARQRALEGTITLLELAPEPAPVG